MKIKHYKKVIIKKKVNIGIKSVFEGANYIGSYTSFSGELGYGTYLGDNCSVNAKVGRFTSIASGVKTINGFHPLEKIVSTHPFFYSNKNCVSLTPLEKSYFKEEKKADKDNKFDVIIGNDVWIGCDVKILAGIKIGDGAVIGTGAVVTKDVEPYTIVGGIPAKIIRKRFSDEIIKKILDRQIWDNELSWYMENRTLFLDVETFLN